MVKKLLQGSTNTFLQGSISDEFMTIEQKDGSFYQVKSPLSELITASETYGYYEFSKIKLTASGSQNIADYAEYKV